MKNSKQTSCISLLLVKSLPTTTQSKFTLEEQLNINQFIVTSLVKNDFIPNQQLRETWINEANSRIEILNKKIKKLRHVHFNPFTKEPSTTKPTIFLEKILSEYRSQFKKKPIEAQELSVKDIINEAINTGISFGSYIEIIHKNEVLFVPSKIGSVSVGVFIKIIEKIHDEECFLLKEKAAPLWKTKPLSGEDESEHTPLFNTRRHWLPLHKYKGFFPAVEPKSTSNNQTENSFVQGTPRAHIPCANEFSVF